MNNNEKANNKDSNWNSQDLIRLSQNLGEAYLPGLDNGKSDKKVDRLTVNKLVEMNKDRDPQSS
ncbi:MAG: hypothetical protein AAFR63_16460 [Cyanobacteria bacterium J06631_6]